MASAEIVTHALLPARDGSPPALTWPHVSRGGSQRSSTFDSLALARRVYRLPTPLIASSDFRRFWRLPTEHGKVAVMVTPSQCRGARGLIDWSQQQLADAARVGVVTVRQFEGGAAQPRNATVDVVRRALEAAGVEFIAENGGGAGVRLKRTRPPDEGIRLEDLNASNDD